MNNTKPVKSTGESIRGLTILAGVFMFTLSSVVYAEEAPQTYGEKAKPSKSTEAVYQQQHALFDQKFTIEPGLTYAHFDRKQLALNGFLALDAIFLGDISVDEVKADILTFDLTGRWGVTPRLQFDLNVPWLYRRTVYSSSGASGGGTGNVSDATVTTNPDVSLGDVSTGMYYQLMPEGVSRPDVVWNLRVKAPTGSDPYGIKNKTAPGNNNLTYPSELPSGNGLWAVSTGFSFVKTTDPAILFANVAYFYNIPRHFNDLSSKVGTVSPGDVKLGDSFQYGLGSAFALNQTTSMSFSFTERFTVRSEIRYDGQSWQYIPGSDANAATLNLGITHSLSNKTAMVGNLGVGLTADAPDLQLSVKFPYTF